MWEMPISLGRTAEWEAGWRRQPFLLRLLNCLHPQLTYWDIR